MNQAVVLMTAAPAAASAGNDTVLTILVVMAALILLVGLIILKKIAGLKAAPSAPAAAPTPTAAPQQWGEDPQMVAAITAAIACMLEPQTAPGAVPSGTPGFVVRRIRRL